MNGMKNTQIWKLKFQYFSYTIHQNTFLEIHRGTQDKNTETLITYKSLDKRLTSLLHINDMEKDKKIDIHVSPFITLSLHLHSSS